MSVTGTRSRTRRGGGPRPGRYIAYADAPPLPEGSTGPALVSAHLRWLLANQDHFASRNSTALAAATRALHHDLQLLGLGGPSGRSEAATRVQVLEQRIKVYESCLRWLDSRWHELLPLKDDSPEHYRYARDILRKYMTEANEVMKESTNERLIESYRAVGQEPPPGVLRK